MLRVSCPRIPPVAADDQVSRDPEIHFIIPGRGMFPGRNRAHAQELESATTSRARAAAHAPLNFRSSYGLVASHS